MDLLPFLLILNPMNNPINYVIKAIFIDGNTFTNSVCLHNPNSNPRVTVLDILIPKGSNNKQTGGSFALFADT